MQEMLLLRLGSQEPSTIFIPSLSGNKWLVEVELGYVWCTWEEFPSFLLVGILGGCRQHDKAPTKTGPTPWHNQVQDLTGRVLKDSQYPSACGGFSDIWSCLYQTGARVGRVRL
ncbi:hypothetical protein HYDPIDRAFT_120524 [Hydnomerulius pinastri MD-312]|uniref:Uncharacterized protein n=1 Tax=Hydnomerulius pinastri MD-312 TaxID=994086 RepID=A0A0C9UWY1_9AGAM|nr:hypothetical protein HYDPIDRAFT_120527 [Hydnomerulius pinastri MD-312]KIJ57594.1 hypothetical protein HYDPIDRAFT_120524 [Hydnomerulius pinastri MD-312]